MDSESENEQPEGGRPLATVQNPVESRWECSDAGSAGTRRCRCRCMRRASLIENFLGSGSRERQV